MIRLTLVEEYRGRRIVTNGEFFGVEGELITDCRYLDVRDTRRAIDSDAGIAQTKNYRDWHERSMPRADYFSDYKKRAFSCRCGWAGRYKDVNRDALTLAVLSCPSCQRALLFITTPSDEDIRRAATRGNKEARAMLRELRAREKVHAEWESQALTRVSQLPDLVGEKLAFIWDLEDDGDVTYYIITVGETRVWRERARPKDWDRFTQVKNIFKRKYRDRFVSLTPTKAARGMLVGGIRSRRLSWR